MSIHPQNPRLPILIRDAEQTILKPLRSHGWEAKIVCEHDSHSSIEIEAIKAERCVRVGLVYSTATANTHYKVLAASCERIFFHGSEYRLDSYTHDIEVPIEPIGDFFPFLVALNKELEPDRTPQNFAVRPKTMRRITDENPRRAVLIRLSQFTSRNLAKKLVVRRAEDASVTLTENQISTKSEGVAYAMRNALDYFAGSPTDRLNKRVLGIYYGTVAFAFAEMLASPNGAVDLDEVEGMTKQGHGLYTVPSMHGGFAGLNVGVLATGFLPRWIGTLGYDTSEFPRKKSKTSSDIEKLASDMYASLEMLFASIPEIDELYSEVFNSGPRWLIPSHSITDNASSGFNGVQQQSGSTYARFIDYSGTLTEKDLDCAGLPLAEITRITPDLWKHEGREFRARVDHVGADTWWDVIPTHSSPFQHQTTLLLPALGGIRDYRVIVTTILYALSIMVRYMPSAWRRIEGGDEDHFLALVNASLSAWERMLPEEFLESIAGERVHTAQPGSWLS